MGYWDIYKIRLDSEVNKRLLFLPYQHSNIPLFHVPGINIRPHKIPLISVSYIISETFN